MARLRPSPRSLHFLLSCSPALPWEREGREAAKPPASAGAQVDASSPLPQAGVWGPEGRRSQTPSGKAQGQNPQPRGLRPQTRQWRDLPPAGRGQVGSLPGPAWDCCLGGLRLFSLSLLSSRLCLLGNLLESNFHLLHSHSLRLQCQLGNVCFLRTRVRGTARIHTCKNWGWADGRACPQVKAGHSAPCNDPSGPQAPSPRGLLTSAMPTSCLHSCATCKYRPKGRTRALLYFELHNVEPHCWRLRGWLLSLNATFGGCSRCDSQQGVQFPLSHFKRVLRSKV